MDEDAPLLCHEPTPSDTPYSSSLYMLSLPCGLLPLGSLKVCGVVVCVSGVLDSMLPSQTPLYSGGEGTIEAASVTSSALVESRGAVAAERSPPICEGERVKCLPFIEARMQRSICLYAVMHGHHLRRIHKDHALE